MPRGKPKNTIKMRKAERQKKAAKRYLEGATQFTIAEELGVTQRTISRDLKEIADNWKAEAIKDVATIKEMELRRLDELEEQAADQYLATGEAKWLDIRLKAMDRRTKLIGLDAAIESKLQMEADLNHGGNINVNLRMVDCGE